MQDAEIVRRNEERATLKLAIDSLQDVLGIYLDAGDYRQACWCYAQMVLYLRRFLYIQHELLTESDRITLENRRAVVAFDMGWNNREERMN